jgi:Holliday junction resolvasome RuvABC endonuclease subunit
VTTLFDLPRPVPTPPPAKPTQPKPLVIALDVAIGTTGVAGDGWTDHIHAKARSLHARIDYQLDGIESFIRNADYVVIEGPAFSRNNNGAEHLAGMRMLARRACWRRGIPYAIVGPQQRIKYLTGTTQPKDPATGKRAKDEVLKGIVRTTLADRYGIETEGRWRYDEADAAAMYCMAMHRLGHRLADIPDSHADALNGCQWWPELGAAA